MTGADLRRWSRLHERRARAWWTSPWLVALVAGGALAAFVAWRARAGVIAGSHAWLAGTIAAFALAFMRVPFHLYWRADAALLAQLPIDGVALFDAAIARCVRAAAATTVTCELGAGPLVRVHVFVHHAVLAIVLGIAAACLLPAVATWAAMLVVAGRTDRGVRAVQVATALAGGNVARAAHAATAPAAPGGPGTILGALPGFASTVVIVVVILAAPWLYGAESTSEDAPLLGGLALGSLLALAATRAAAPHAMGTILRDVSAPHRPRPARLDLHPPRASERAAANLLGDGALPYRKDARLMRRRYPMAFALGALAFVVLVVIGLSRPDDPWPWFVATLAGAALYAVALAGRLRRPPIELRRLSSTLPISAAARARAKLAWIVTWSLVFVAVPAVFALARL